MSRVIDPAVKRARVQFAAAAVLTLLAAGTAVLISTQPLASVIVDQGPPHGPQHVNLESRSVDGATTAFALVAIAGIVAVLATRGWPRRVFGALIALSGVGMIWRSAATLHRLSPGREAELVRAKRPILYSLNLNSSMTMHYGWAWLSVVCGALVLLAGLLVSLRGQNWGGMSSRYETPAAQRDQADRDVRNRAGEDDPERARALADRAMWAALERGDDPTAHDPTQPR